MRELHEQIRAEVGRVVIGNDRTVELMLSALVLGGHVLLEGAPGVAKSLLASAFARTVGGEYRRVQFTPDMLPSDVTGTMTLQGGELVFRAGPVFTNVLLADEINRTPPKTQSALLEAMQERQVSLDGTAHRLPNPFLVVATQNPIEYEGTYPLPEAQLDRFFVRADVGYPDEEEERQILQLGRQGVSSPPLGDVQAVLDEQGLAEVRTLLDQTTATDDVIAYVADLVRATRTLPSVSLGASPRAGVHLLALSKAGARLAGRDFVVPDDVAGAAQPVLAHRLVLTPDAELEQFRPADAVAAALSAVPVPR